MFVFDIDKTPNIRFFQVEVEVSIRNDPGVQRYLIDRFGLTKSPLALNITTYGSKDGTTKYFKMILEYGKVYLPPSNEKVEEMIKPIIRKNLKCEDIHLYFELKELRKVPEIEEYYNRIFIENRHVKLYNRDKMGCLKYVEIENANSYMRFVENMLEAIILWNMNKLCGENEEGK